MGPVLRTQVVVEPSDLRGPLTQAHGSRVRTCSSHCEMLARRPLSVLVDLAIASLVTPAILTIISMVRLNQSMDQMAERSSDECHERKRNR